MALKASDLMVGDVIVIVELADQAPAFESDPYARQERFETIQSLRRLIGWPLRCVALSPPFIAIVPLTPGWQYDQLPGMPKPPLVPAPIDTREVVIGRPRPDYSDVFAKGVAREPSR